MTLHELANSVAKEYERKFKGSQAFVKSGFSSDKYIFITCLAAKSKQDYINGIWQNDPIHLKITINQHSDKFSLKFDANSITSKPKSKYMAYGRERITATGVKKPLDAKTVEKRILRSFDNLEKTLKNMIENDLVHNNHKRLLGDML